MTSADTRAELLKLNGRRVMLSFSRGKDSIGCWLALRSEGFEVIPVHLETVPGLAFVRESVAYYEKFFGTKVINVPHPGFLRMINNNVFQPPLRAGELLELELHRRLDYRDIFDGVAEENGCGPWYCTGMRASDSLTRRFALKKHGPLLHSQKKAHVIWDWTADQLFSEIKSSGVRLPVDYKMFGRSFDGLDAEYLAPLKARFPEDYARILEYFPLAGIELFRDEKMRVAP